jgi:hypothetical protein
VRAAVYRSGFVIRPFGDQRSKGFCLVKRRWNGEKLSQIWKCC